MRFWKCTTLMLFIVLLAPVAALAVIDASHHDMSAWLSTNKYTCYACHGIKDSAWSNNNLQLVGNMCYNRCHSGTGLATSVPIAATRVPRGDLNGASIAYASNASDIQKYGSAHGMSSSALVPQPDAAATMEGTGWPHTTSGAQMECTSCHNVHSNTATPFLWGPLSDAATPASSFCMKCHAGGGTAAPANSATTRYALMTAAPNGAHPSEVNDWLTAAGTRNTNGRLPRTISVKGTVYATVSANGAALNAATTHYVVGGKLGNFQNAASGGTIGCYTCHSAHMPGSIAGTGTNLLITAMAPAGSTQTIDPLCNGCHGPGPTPTGTSDANPGMTNYYHPVNAETSGNIVGTFDNTNKIGVYKVSSGDFNITVYFNNGGLKKVMGNGAIVCTSCHEYDVHGGVVGSKAIANEFYNITPMCDGCHNAPAGTTFLNSAANSHHATGNNNYTATGFGGYSNPSWATADGFGDLADGLACQDCHVFNKTAHNW